MHLAILIAGILSFFWRHGNFFTLAVKPGFLDFDNLPDTNFSCENKVIGGYYADIETGCQMFHVCTLGQKGEVTDIKFLCLNGTVFDQETRVCERLDEVDCSKSESYFDLNLELYGNNGGGFGIEPESESPGTSEKEEDEEEEKCSDEDEECKSENGEEEFVDEYDEATLPPTTTTTSTTTTTTTTPRMTTARVSFTTRPAFKITPPPTIQYPPSPAQNTPAPYNNNYPDNLQYSPPSSPETIAALLALHNAFQESLKNHDPTKQTSTPSAVQPPRPLSQQTPKQKDAQGQARPSQSTNRFPAPFTNPKPSGFTISNYHPQSSQTPQFSPPKQQFHFETTSVSKPTFTSERFGTPNFHHGFHIGTQANQSPTRQFSAFQQPSLRYFDGNKHTGSLAGGAVPKPFSYPQIPNQNMNLPLSEEKPESSLRLRQAEESEEGEQEEEILDDDIGGQKSLETHSSFVRAIPESPKQARKVVYPSLTTPAVSVVLTTSSVSSSRAQVSGKNAPSAIKTPQTSGQGLPLRSPVKVPFNVRQNTTVSVRSEKPKLRPSFSQYQDEHANYETFFPDVSKIRNKRNISPQQNESVPGQTFDIIKVTGESHQTANQSKSESVDTPKKLGSESQLIAQICVNNSTLNSTELGLGREQYISRTSGKENISSKKPKLKAYSKTSLKNFHNVDFELLPSMTTVVKPVNFKVKKKMRSLKNAE